MPHKVFAKKAGGFKGYLGVLTGSSFLRQNAVLFIGSALVGVCNYLYYPILARLLEPAPYGEVQALAALFTQLSLFLVVLGQVTVNIVTNYTDEEKKQKVLFELEKFAFILSIGLLIVLGLFSWKLKAFFQFESVVPFILLLVAIVASVPVAFRSAYLRAHKRFVSASIAQLIGAVGKVILSAALVIVGYKSAGAMGGIVLSQVLVFGYTIHKARQLGFFRPKESTYFSWPSLRIILPELKYALLVLAASLAITLISTIDVFVVKHYFDPHTAGEYAGISTVAKVIFFLTASITQVMLPSVRLNQPKHTNRMYLLKSLGLILVIGGGATVIFTLFSRTIVSALMGSSYLTYVELLPALSLVMFLMSVINLLIAYYLALRNYHIGVIVVLGTAFIAWLMFIRHTSLTDVVSNMMYGSIAILCLFLVWWAANLTMTRKDGQHV